MSLENDALAIVRSIKGDAEPKAARDIYAEIVFADGAYYAKADGSDELAPVVSAATIHHGDRVIVHIIDHKCVVVQNITVPSVNDEQYEHVKDIAEEANTLLDGVAEAAAQADKSVAEILTNSDTASGLVDGMQQAATQAGQSLDQIVADAAEANTTLNGMREAAAEAGTTLDGIYDDAKRANIAADAALVQLSVVQDVAGTLDWISRHGTFVPTTDTEPQEGTVYFERTVGGWVPVVQPTGNPSEQGWAVLDVSDSQTAYIMAHLAVTDMGLWVLPNGYSGQPRYGEGYKMLLASDGMRLYDSSGKEAIRYGDAIQVASDRAFYLGNDDAYILFTPATATRKASITIGGGNVSIGGDKTLAELLEASAGYRYDYNYTESNGVYTYTAYLTRGSEDISSQVPDGAWWWTLEQEGEHIDLPSGRTLVFQDGMIVNGTAVYRGYNPSMAGGVLDRYEEDAVLVDESGDAFVDESGNRLAVGLVWEVA